MTCLHERQLSTSPVTNHSTLSISITCTMQSNLQTWPAIDTKQDLKAAAHLKAFTALVVISFKMYWLGRMRLDSLHHCVFSILYQIPKFQWKYVIGLYFEQTGFYFCNWWKYSPVIELAAMEKRYIYNIIINYPTFLSSAKSKIESQTLITWPLASKCTLSYTTPQCVWMLLTFCIRSHRI